MAEDLKRNGALSLTLKQSSDDRKLSLAASPSKRVIIKSADMKDDMQKEAIDIAIAVVFLSLLISVAWFFSFLLIENDSPVFCFISMIFGHG